MPAVRIGRLRHWFSHQGPQAEIRLSNLPNLHKSSLSTMHVMGKRSGRHPRDAIAWAKDVKKQSSSSSPTRLFHDQTKLLIKPDLTCGRFDFCKTKPDPSEVQVESDLINRYCSMNYSENLKPKVKSKVRFKKKKEKRKGKWLVRLRPSLSLSLSLSVAPRKMKNQDNSHTASAGERERARFYIGYCWCIVIRFLYELETKGCLDSTGHLVVSIKS